MGAVTESGTLLIGTNTFAILTQSITDWVNHRDYDFEYQQAIEAGDYSGEEEGKYDEDGVYWDPDNYADSGLRDPNNILEGKNINDVLA